jgi:hypothetical protein
METNLPRMTNLCRKPVIGNWDFFHMNIKEKAKAGNSLVDYVVRICKQLFLKIHLLLVHFWAVSVPTTRKKMGTRL